MVMNYTEMEAKVREATNDDAWGASSSLMQEIAQATFNFQVCKDLHSRSSNVMLMVLISAFQRDHACNLQALH